MIFKHRVNYNGTYYEAGQDVPIGSEGWGTQKATAFSDSETWQKDMGVNAKNDLPKNTRKYTFEELQDMTVREIRTAAAELGFEIKKTAREDVVNEFMEKQG